MKVLSKSISLFVVCLIVITIWWIGTDGFTGFTQETARVNKLIEEKPMIMPITLEDSKGRMYTFHELKGRRLFLTFIYTSCGTVCPQLEKNMQQVYESLPREILDEKIMFLTISFDPDRDTVEVLDTYRQYFGSDGETWRMARIANKLELKELLDAFGVIVLPDRYGGFTHNSAFYYVDENGRLTNVLDYKDIEGAQAFLHNELLGSEMK